MKSKRLVGLRDNVGRAWGEESRNNRLRADLILGDVIWVKINGNNWWPGQVVDENNVSDALKPQNRLAGEILVRLYGSYEYVYVDPLKCTAEFENILKQNNGSYGEIFRKALEHDLSCIRSSRRWKKGDSKPRGTPTLEAAKVEKLKQHGTRRTREADGLSFASNSPIRQEDNSRSQKRVKSGELVSRKAGEEASKNDAPKRGLVQTKLKANIPSSARSSPGRQQDNGRTRKRVGGETISSEKWEEASKQKQDVVQKKLKANSQNSASRSPRRQQDNSRSQKRVKSGELVSRKAGEEASKNDTPKRGLVQKKLKANIPSSARSSPRRQQDNDRTRKRVGGELSSSEKGKEASKKKQDVVQKKLKANSQNSARGSSRRQQGSSRPQNPVNSELISKKAGEGASEIDTQKQVQGQKKLRADSPNSVSSSVLSRTY
ncbi:uncharacterized protein LOC122075175 isoform X2 [Macadamia integrifolia]|uniref:uncharacterized protein LOC122075175 isoform X2 n=1 Tax=Macadamia integrifolia TaxID=60698 RepID=UPI001C4F3EDD|nr:uncharacterized protein LOC122075175 isoform X2 [Macadamia integrifolia]